VRCVPLSAKMAAVGELTDVRRFLDEARQAGQSFGDAWPRALALAPHGFTEARHAQAAAWRRAFEGKPATRAEHALVVVASSCLGRHLGAGRCGFCTVLITGVDGPYCSTACAQAGAHTRATGHRADLRLRHR
jgi:hypothetical protein